MDPEVCDYVELENGICKHFIGNKNNPRDIEYCHNHCSLMEDKELMEPEHTQRFTKKNGRWRKI